MADPMVRAIAAALIPAAMISASAVILQGVWAEHRALADRIRACSAELRAFSGDPRRKQSLVAQLVSFRHRVRISTVASLSASSAVACFVMLMLSIAMLENLQSRGLVLVAFVTGAALLLIAITLVLADLWLASRTLDIELEDHDLSDEEERKLAR